MLVFAAVFAISLAIWYWQNYRHSAILFALHEEPREPHLLDPLRSFWDRFQFARPFLWDIFRLIVVPYLIQKLIAFVF